MDRPVRFQRLFAAVTHFYSSNHGSEPFGLKIHETPQPTKAFDDDGNIVDALADAETTDYCRYAWRNMAHFMKKEFSRKELELQGFEVINGRNSNCPYEFKMKYRAADARRAAAEIIKEECDFFGIDTVRLLRFLVATITKQHRDAVHRAWNNHRIPAETAELIQALMDLKMPTWERFDPTRVVGRNDARSSCFMPNLYGIYAGEGPDWFDQQLFGAGSCLVLAAELSKRTGWRIIQEQQPGAFLDQCNIHAWALRPDGRAVDIWGVRDGDWAAGYLHKSLGEPFGDLADVTGWAKTGYQKKIRDEANRVISSFPEFFGVDELQMAA